MGVKLKDLQQVEFVRNYKRMWKYIRPVWFRSLLSLLIAIPIGSLDGLIALLLRPYMDVVMVAKDPSFSPYFIALAIISITLTQGLLKYAASYLSTWTGTRITHALKAELYQKLLTYQSAFFDKNQSGTIILRFNNAADMACSGLLTNASQFTQRFFSSIFLIGVLFYNSWQLALVAVAVMLVAFLPVLSLKKRLKDVFNKSLFTTAAILSAFNETFSGNKTITSYNLQENRRQKFQEILNSIFRMQIRMVQRTQWISPAMHTIVSFGIAGTIGYGSYLILNDQITVGAFVSFITALILLYTPMKSIGGNIAAITQSFLAMDVVFGLLDTEVKIKDKEGAKTLDLQGDFEIKFENVNFAYDTNKQILKGVSFAVKRGETLALVGNSGGGKSTSVSLLPRFYDVTGGQITINGEDIRDFTLQSLRQNIAVVFQENFLFDDTIRQNILIAKPDASQEEVEAAVKMAYLDEFVGTLENGLDTVVGERGVLLSGGQKQRVAIARAFLKNAPILVLDEATSALDNKAEAIVQKAIENLMQDKTVIVIAHRLSTVKNADKIIVINEGEVAESGSHEALLEKQGVYASLYAMQFKR